MDATAAAAAAATVASARLKIVAAVALSENMRKTYTKTPWHSVVLLRCTIDRQH